MYNTNNTYNTIIMVGFNADQHEIVQKSQKKRTTASIVNALGHGDSPPALLLSPSSSLDPALFGHSWQSPLPGQVNSCIAGNEQPSTPHVGLHEIDPPRQSLSQRNLEPCQANVYCLKGLSWVLFMVTDVRLLQP